MSNADTNHYRDAHATCTESLPFRAQEVAAPSALGERHSAPIDAEPSTFADVPSAEADVDSEHVRLCREATLGTEHERRRLLMILLFRALCLLSTAGSRLGTIRGCAHSCGRKTSHPTLSPIPIPTSHRAAEMARQVDILHFEHIINPTVLLFNNATLLPFWG